ncbi:hypothetical protein GCM10010862_13630 [Devosia nitrariae]|uniref:Uncharacterized protein n=1 Tax=Devosia nitrariae TaxID=2071872 RepID=A0ABQ5W2R6_9HYPH|nr:hypothetical protein GCM10010862_13630 [Devosia nitrariae]
MRNIEQPRRSRFVEIPTRIREDGWWLIESGEERLPPPRQRRCDLQLITGGLREGKHEPDGKSGRNSR